MAMTALRQRSRITAELLPVLPAARGKDESNRHYRTRLRENSSDGGALVDHSSIGALGSQNSRQIELSWSLLPFRFRHVGVFTLLGPKRTRWQQRNRRSRLKSQSHYCGFSVGTAHGAKFSPAATCSLPGASPPVLSRSIHLAIRDRVRYPERPLPDRRRPRTEALHNVDHIPQVRLRSRGYPGRSGTTGAASTQFQEARLRS